eukprot:GGOE01013745.1.p2 GENE.GGOE01013745.1~~GGOE01013745.1.p2  ORF type:complete len:251 (-),score=73.52 GGOE01013745.1:206-937(-)
MSAPLFSSGGVTLTQRAGVFVLTMDRQQNVINDEINALLSDALRVVEEAPAPKAFVITGVGKFFCNGLDLRSLKGPRAAENPFIVSFWKFLARLLTLDCHTVCAINGHAFGAGLFIALACDWRVMRTQQGMLCFPELGLGMPLSTPFAELVKAKVSRVTFREAVLTGKRYGSGEALRAGLIDKECATEELLLTAELFARQLLPPALKAQRFRPSSFVAMKMELYGPAYRALASGVDAPLSSRL